MVEREARLPQGIGRSGARAKPGFTELYGIERAMDDPVRTTPSPILAEARARKAMAKRADHPIEDRAREAWGARDLYLQAGYPHEARAMESLAERLHRHGRRQAVGKARR